MSHQSNNEIYPENRHKYIVDCSVYNNRIETVMSFSTMYSTQSHFLLLFTSHWLYCISIKQIFMTT